MATTNTLPLGLARIAIERYPKHFRDGLNSVNPRDLGDALSSLLFHLGTDPGSMLVAYAAGQLAHALQQYA